MVLWKNLEREAQIDEFIERSGEKPAVIFKHSTRCGISSMALRNLERDWEIGEEEVEAWYLDLLRYRSVSDKVAETFGVRHESPQLILIKGGKAVFHASHSSISAAALKEKL